MPSSRPPEEHPAEETAGRLLARRAYARADLSERLARRHGAQASAVVVEVLERYGVVDDAAYATAVADARLRRGYGPAAVRHDLERSGVDDEVIAAAIAQVDADRWDAAARIAARGETGARTARRLAARGFEEETIVRILDLADED